MPNRVLMLFLVAAVACRTPPPPPPQVPPVVAPLPPPVLPVVEPLAQTPTTAEAPSRVDEALLVALAAHDTPTLATLLADDVSVTLANGEACTGTQACAQAIAGALAETKWRIVRRLQPAPNVAILQGLVELGPRRIPFAAVAVMAGGRIVQVRAYANTLPWRYALDAPKAQLPVAATEPVDNVAEPATFAAPTLAAAFDPALLATDATAAGQVALDMTYRDATAGTETKTALANQAAIRAFQDVFEVVATQAIGQFAAGDWLVLEREVTLRQRAPVVPLPPIDELLHVRTLEVLRVEHGKITQVWGYSDPLAFLPAVEQPPIPNLH